MHLHCKHPHCKLTAGDCGDGWLDAGCGCGRWLGGNCGLEAPRTPKPEDNLLALQVKSLEELGIQHQRFREDIGIVASAPSPIACCDMCPAVTWTRRTGSPR